jgi:hypothetical protein
MFRTFGWQQLLYTVNVPLTLNSLESQGIIKESRKMDGTQNPESNNKENNIL